MTTKDIGGYENYPIYIVLLRDLIVAVWIISGAFTMKLIGEPYMIAYAIYALVVFLFISAFVCRCCFYFGKICDNGMGKISKLLFRKKGDEKDYAKWAGRSVPPLIILAMAPLIAGFAAKKIDNWFFVYIAALAMFFITAPLTACNHCKNRSNCPVCMVKKG